LGAASGQGRGWAGEEEGKGDGGGSGGEGKGRPQVTVEPGPLRALLRHWPASSVCVSLSLTSQNDSLSCVGRTEDPFSAGWRDPKARDYVNLPLHPVDGDTEPAAAAEPFSPMGFADITGGLRGSRQSLDRAPDDRAGPTGGSNRSLNRSQDNGAAAGNPRTRGRDAAAARGSNRSLNRSQLLSFSPSPSVGSGVERIDPLRLLAGCRKRRINQAVSVLSLSLDYFEYVCCAVNLLR